MKISSKLIFAVCMPVLLALLIGSTLIYSYGRILAQGRNVSLWKVEVLDDASLLVAEATVTVAISGGGGDKQERPNTQTAGFTKKSPPPHSGFCQVGDHSPVGPGKGIVT